MTNFVRKFVNDESGASAAEYALILVVMASPSSWPQLRCRVPLAVP